MEPAAQDQAHVRQDIVLAILLGLVLAFLVTRGRRETREGGQDEHLQEGSLVAKISLSLKLGELKMKLPLQRWVAAPQDNAGIGSKILILSYGTRGDIEPMIALGLKMQQVKLKPLICAPDCYQHMIECEGLGFLSMGVEKVEQPDTVFNTNHSSIADVLSVLADVYPIISRTSFEIASEVRPSLIVCTALTRSFTMHIAEYLRIPCFCAHFVASDVPTRHFPPCEFIKTSQVASRLLPKFLLGYLNKSLYFWRGLGIIRAAIATGLAKADEEFRMNVVGLPRADPLQGMRDVDEQPSFHAYALQIQQRPADWPEHVINCGFWRKSKVDYVKSKTTQITEGNNVQPVLANFIKEAHSSSKQIVLITFGSMQLPGDLLQHVTSVAISLDCFVIACSSKANSLDPDFTQTEKSILHVHTSISYDAVFPHCSCIVHHGGAGTTASALYAGAPSIVIPIFQWSDQPYWASRVELKGCGVQLPLKDALEDNTKTISALEKALSPNTRSKAKLIQAELLSEPDGAEFAAKIVLTYCQQLSQQKSLML